MADMTETKIIYRFKQQTSVLAVQAAVLLLDPEDEAARSTAVVSELPKVIPLERKRLLAFLRGLQVAGGEPMDTSSNPVMTGLEIDRQECSLCGLCSMLCPTGALKGVTTADAAGVEAQAEINFIAARCVKCGLCLVACFRQAVRYVNQLEE